MRISIKAAHISLTLIILESKISRDHSPVLNQQSLWKEWDQGVQKAKMD